jgi:hypothetical protein
MTVCDLTVIINNNFYVSEWREITKECQFLSLNIYTIMRGLYEFENLSQILEYKGF